MNIKKWVTYSAESLCCYGEKMKSLWVLIMKIEIRSVVVDSYFCFIVLRIALVVSAWKSSKPKKNYYCYRLLFYQFSCISKKKKNKKKIMDLVKKWRFLYWYHGCFLFLFVYWVYWDGFSVFLKIIVYGWVFVKQFYSWWGIYLSTEHQ